MTNECRCGRPTRQGHVVCETCLTDLERALGDVPWLDSELEVTITRQKGVDYRRVGGGKGGRKPAEAPSPANWGASEARTHLRALLVSWTLLCAEEGVRRKGGADDLPADELGALSRWLMTRVDGLGLHDAGPDAVDEITSAVAHCHRLIDRPADRQYLGTCEVCAGRLYARPGSAWATCYDCHATTNAEVVRKNLLEELDDRLCTAAEIARLSTYLGLRADREVVRKRINQWSSRGVIAEHPGVTDEVTFRFGEVYAMLAAAEYGVSKAAG